MCHLLANKCCMYKIDCMAVHGCGDLGPALATWNLSSHDNVAVTGMGCGLYTKSVFIG